MKTNLSRETFALYLKKLGWISVPSNRNAIDIYIEPATNEPIEILLPNREISDSKEIIDSAVNVLSSYLDKSKETVEKYISGIDKDFHNYRIKDPHNSPRTIIDSAPVTLVQSLVSATRFMLQDASKFHAKNDYQKLSQEEKKNHQSPKEVSKDFLGKCRFLHTWIGSFGITIETPLQIPSLGLFDNTQIPESLGRKTTKSVLKGFNLVNAALEKKSVDYLFDSIGDSKKEFLILSHFNDLLDSIKNYNIEYSVATSPIIKLNNDILPTSGINIDRKSLHYIETAINKLKTSDKIQKISFVGFPEAIRSSKQGLLSEETTKDIRKVTVKGTSKDIGHASLTMSLSIDNYMKALKAQQERKDVQVVCEVKQVLKGWEVIKVHAFDHI
jgi:hypothetical protein